MFKSSLITALISSAVMCSAFANTSPAVFGQPILKTNLNTKVHAHKNMNNFSGNWQGTCNVRQAYFDLKVSIDTEEGEMKIDGPGINPDTVDMLAIETKTLSYSDSQVQYTRKTRWSSDLNAIIIDSTGSVGHHDEGSNASNKKMMPLYSFITTTTLTTVNKQLMIDSLIKTLDNKTDDVKIKCQLNRVAS